MCIYVRTFVQLQIFRVLHAVFVLSLIIALAYINWSVFTSLTPVLFYFSVWELSLSGSELALLSTLSPIVLAIPVVLDVASSRTGRTVLHLLTLVGLGAFVLKSPVERLFAVAFANSALCIGWVVDWSATPATLGYQSLCAFHNLPPLWTRLIPLQ